MNTPLLLQRFGTMVVIGLASTHVFSARGGGTLDVCDEAALRNALEGGGTVVCECDGVIELSATLQITNHTVIDSTGRAVEINGGDTVRLFNVSTNASLVLRHLSLRQGFAQTSASLPAAGGAVYSESPVTAIDCAFQENRAVGATDQPGFGGAVFVKNAILIASNCQFSANSAAGGNGANVGELEAPHPGLPGAGGAVYVDGGTLRLHDCRFARNEATGGVGGFRFGNPTPASGGQAQGGAVFNGGGTVESRQSQFVHNLAQCGGSADAFGGAIHQESGTLVLMNSLVQSNRVETIIGRLPGSAHGGGIHAAAGTLNVTNCAFAENLALGSDAGPKVGIATPMAGWGQGGGISCGGTLNVVNSTIASNSAVAGAAGSPQVIPGQGTGGGIHMAGTGSIRFSTIAGNRAVSSDGAAGLGGGVFVFTGSTDLQDTIVAYNVPGANASGSIVDAGGNISSDATPLLTQAGSHNNLDPILGPLDNYGGATPSMALLADSPAIDGANASGAPPTDQRGWPRPSGMQPDSGAFESGPPFSIRGRIATVEPAAVFAVNAGAISVNSENGRYVLSGIAAGTHEVLAANPDFFVTPARTSVTVGPDRAGVDFEALRWNRITVLGASSGVINIAFAATNAETFNIRTSTNLLDWSSLDVSKAGDLFHWKASLPMETNPSAFFGVRKGD